MGRVRVKLYILTTPLPLLHSQHDVHLLFYVFGVPSPINCVYLRAHSNKSNVYPVRRDQIAVNCLLPFSQIIEPIVTSPDLNPISSNSVGIVAIY
ncbi:hypothetical protein EV426DRAFT_362032 [Tirmania nivea]|nr:hypothetical protein EV426DRAFT_362032 [Tirmania nivea]